MAHKHHADGPAGCYGCRLKSIQFGTKGFASQITDLRERTLSKDLDAYKRMRRQGIQPNRIDGSAAIEAKANSEVEVERHTIMSTPIRKELEAVMRNVDPA